MRAAQIVFSPTGGTQKVMDILTDGWGMPMERIDLSDPRLDEEDWPGSGAAMRAVCWSVCTATGLMRIRWWNWRTSLCSAVSR